MYIGYYIRIITYNNDIQSFTKHIRTAGLYIAIIAFISRYALSLQS